MTKKEELIEKYYKILKEKSPSNAEELMEELGDLLEDKNIVEYKKNSKRIWTPKGKTLSDYGIEKKLTPEDRFKIGHVKSSKDGSIVKIDINQGGGHAIEQFYSHSHKGLTLIYLLNNLNKPMRPLDVLNGFRKEYPERILKETASQLLPFKGLGEVNFEYELQDKKPVSELSLEEMKYSLLTLKVSLDSPNIINLQVCRKAPKTYVMYLE